MWVEYKTILLVALLNGKLKKKSPLVYLEKSELSGLGLIYD